MPLTLGFDKVISLYEVCVRTKVDNPPFSLKFLFETSKYQIDSNTKTDSTNAIANVIGIIEVLLSIDKVTNSLLVDDLTD